MMFFARNILTSICILAVSFSIRCTTQSTPIAEPTPEPTPTPVYTVDEKGNDIKPGGWPEFKPNAKAEETKTISAKYRDGRPIEVRVATYAGPKMGYYDDPAQNNGNGSSIFKVEAYSVGSGRVFCYVFSVSGIKDNQPMAMMTKIKHCDMDGDGIFELRGNGLPIPVVPDWVK